MPPTPTGPYTVQCFLERLAADGGAVRPGVVRFVLTTGQVQEGEAASTARIITESVPAEELERDPAPFELLRNRLLGKFAEMFGPDAVLPLRVADVERAYAEFRRELAM